MTDTTQNLLSCQEFQQSSQSRNILNLRLLRPLVGWHSPICDEIEFIPRERILFKLVYTQNAFSRVKGIFNVMVMRANVFPSEEHSNIFLGEG